MNPSFNEDDISQIPALLFLQVLGYTYLSPAEALKLRGGKSSNVLLEEVLREKLQKDNTFKYKERTYQFSETNISNAIFALQEYPLQEGYMASNKYLYDLLTLGKSFEETILGDRKSYTLQYIDWKNPQNNVFHVTEELSVQRSNRSDTFRPDIVLYVNGIPLVVIECKSPKIDCPLQQAISQHLRNQNDDGIRALYVFSQMCIGLSDNVAQYATTATKEEFWGAWREQHLNRRGEDNHKKNLQSLKNESINNPNYWTNLTRNSERKKQVNPYQKALGEQWNVTNQDELLFNICRPERLFDLIFNFVIYDNNDKIIARYQQYFGVRKTLERLKITSDSPLGNGLKVRSGGVIWHTQGSGKSYTMVMLAQLLAMEKSIPNPKIILVTDRVELDDQIYQTFDKCDKEVVQAKTGNDLVDYLGQSSDAIVTTIINKFDAAVKKLAEPVITPNIFVLVDEGHRTQYGTLNVKMRRVLPTACFIAFTGTPLMKKEKNTAAKFGGIIDSYTVADAVLDGAVVPLLFEGRSPIFNVNERPLDNYFNKISEPLNDYQRADLKRKFSTQSMLNAGEQIIYAKAMDIAEHYSKHIRPEGFKGQLVCDSKLEAVRFKRYLDQHHANIKSEVLFSPPDDREGSEDAYGTVKDEVIAYWKKLQDKYGTSPKKYDDDLRRAFKSGDLEIIIVVDKLLTGFDNPRNKVMYLCRKLKEHTLFQAITRVNRKCAGKDFGLIIDYNGVIEELDRTLRLYTTYEDYDNLDLVSTITDVREQIEQLPQAHSIVWDVFKGIQNRQDTTAFQKVLEDDAVRTIFYERLSRFGKLLKLALSNYEFTTQTPETEQEQYKNDLRLFLDIRKSAIGIHDEQVEWADFQKFEKQVQNLIDTHVSADDVQTITPQVNIFDKQAFEEALLNLGSDSSKAHAIAAKVSKTATEKMDEDPVFYKRFSQMIKDTLEDYHLQRINETEFLKRVNEIKDSVLNRRADDVPDVLQNKDTAQAIFRVFAETNKFKEETATLAIEIEDIIQKIVFIRSIPIIDWQNKSDVVGKLRTELDDLLWDFKENFELDWNISVLDDLIEKLINIAKVRFNGKV